MPRVAIQSRLRAEDTEKEEKGGEQASEGTEGHHEAPKEDEGK